MSTRRMLNWSVALAAFVGVVLSGCEQKKAPAESTAAALDMNGMADLIVNRCKLQPGEQVLLVALPGRFDSLVTLLEQAISKTGATYLGTFSTDSLNQPEAWTTDFIRAARHKSPTDLMAQFGEVDLGIMLPGAVPTDKPYAAMQEVLNLGFGRTIHFHWSGAYSLSGEVMDVTPAIDQLYQRVLFETNYDSLSAKQLRFDSAMRGNDIRVTTPAGTNLTFRIGDRQVTKQDGDASLSRMQYARNLIDREVELPAGAIRVAPIEGSVEGTVAFPDGMWNGQKAEGVILTFKKGKVVNIAARSGQEAVKAELDKAGDPGYSFRELAVGFNPLLVIPKENPYFPYYGYGAGIIRLSLGDNTELGGQVSGGYVRWNFFPDATVTIGTETWVKDGVLVK